MWGVWLKNVMTLTECMAWDWPLKSRARLDLPADGLALGLGRSRLITLQWYKSLGEINFLHRNVSGLYLLHLYPLCDTPIGHSIKIVIKFFKNDKILHVGVKIKSKQRSQEENVFLHTLPHGRGCGNTWND